MSPTEMTRRNFLGDLTRAAAAGGLALHLPWLVSIAGCASESNPFAQLTPADARTMRAFAAQIIPSDDDTAGAEEAGAVYFVDRALGMPFFADNVPVIRAGLADLDRRAWAIGGRGMTGFASLPSTQQALIMREIEHDEFFKMARTLVVIGTFASPSYGGNRNGSGWMMIGMEHHPSYLAPFGWYDAPRHTDSTKHAA